MKRTRKKTVRTTYRRRVNKSSGMSFMRKNLKQMLGDIGDSIKGIF